MREIRKIFPLIVVLATSYPSVVQLLALLFSNIFQLPYFLVIIRNWSSSCITNTKSISKPSLDLEITGKAVDHVGILSASFLYLNYDFQASLPFLYPDTDWYSYIQEIQTLINKNPWRWPDSWFFLTIDCAVSLFSWKMYSLSVSGIVYDDVTFRLGHADKSG